MKLYLSKKRKDLACTKSFIFILKHCYISTLTENSACINAAGSKVSGLLELTIEIPKPHPG
jgi:hypothetical protein